MGNLLNSLVTVADSMRTTQLAIETSGNNITNAKTPGFAKQRLDLIAKRFEVNRGFAGGVESGKLISGRKAFLEQGVHEQAHRYGRFAQEASNLERLEPVFDVAANSGVAATLNRMFAAFSAWSVNPNDTPVRQAVLDRARDMAASFRFTVSAMGALRSDGQSDLRAAVDKINAIGGQIQKYNLEVRSDARKQQDPGLDAQLHHQLESLAEVVDFDLIRAEDGSYAVNLGGQTSLTVGASLYPISADFSGPKAVIRDASGNDISGQLQQGRIRGLLDVQNGFMAELSTGLDRLAKTVADAVNAQLAGGLDRSGNPPTTALFAYDETQGVAGSLVVNDIGTDELAAASAGAPGGNGNALDLSDIARERLIDDFTVSQFYGNMAGQLGRTLANSRSDESTQALLLAQAKNMRAEESEVSLDEEATILVAFQRQYEANGQLIRILNELTETTINIIR